MSTRTWESVGLATGTLLLGTVAGYWSLTAVPREEAPPIQPLGTEVPAAVAQR